jgi:hypothetical protein
MNSNTIWYDSEAYNGRGTRDESMGVYATNEFHPGPTNEMSIPCGDCAMVKACTANLTECSAFRQWAEKGTYDLIDDKGRSTIGKLLRSI